MSFISNTFTLAYPKGKSRIDLLDFLRGVAMLLVMMQHSGFPGSPFIVAFHMPLFFFLSGFVSGSRELPSFDKYFVSRFKRLMVPYFTFGLLCIIIYYISGLLTNSPYPIGKALLGLITGQYGYVSSGNSGIYWFFMTMFVADLLIYPINKFLNNNTYVKLGGAFLFVALSYITTHYYPIPIFTLEKSFVAAAFLLIGSCCKTYMTVLCDGKYHWWEVVLVVICCALVLCSLHFNSARILMYLNQYGNYGWFILGAISGIVTAMLVGKWLYLLLSKNKRFIYNLIMWIGFNSLVVFPIHLMVNGYLEVFYSQLGRGTAPLRLLMMIVIGIPICNIITNYLPWMLGQSRKH